MVVLRRESPTSLLVINPHLQNVKKEKGPASIIENRNTVCKSMNTHTNLASTLRSDVAAWDSQMGRTVYCRIYVPAILSTFSGAPAA